MTSPKKSIHRKHGKHGHSPSGKATPTYRSWDHMIQRCTNSGCTHFAYYGGRGITVCPEWLSFAGFLRDMGERPAGTSLDRFPDNQGNYEPGNCRWATRTEQMNNTRQNRIVVFQGQRYTLKQLADKVGIQRRTLYRRIVKYGMNVDVAVRCPVRPGRHVNF